MRRAPQQRDQMLGARTTGAPSEIQHVRPRDVPAEIAARRLGTSLFDFKVKLPSLLARGFPKPDPDTANFDPSAIERWCDYRHPHLFDADPSGYAQHAEHVASDRILLLKSKLGRG
jgi:hypothetical protein